MQSLGNLPVNYLGLASRESRDLRPLRRVFSSEAGDLKQEDVMICRVTNCLRGKFGNDRVSIANCILAKKHFFVSRFYLFN